MDNHQAEGQPAFLNENGVTVTSTRPVTPKRTFELARIKSVRIVGHGGPLFSLLLGGKALLQLQVSDKPGAKPVNIYETDDAEFMKRIQNAMDQAAAANRAKKVV